MRIYNSKLTLNRAIIIIFLIINIGFYYAQYLTLINIGYLLLGGYFVFQCAKKQVSLNTFIILSILFLLYSFVSIIWSVDFDKTLQSTTQLMKVIIPTIALISLIKDKEDFYWAIAALSIASFIYAILFMQNVDITQLAYNRITMATDDADSTPNVNLVGLYLTFSFTFFLFTYFKNKNLIFLIAAIISIFIITTLGSRKSILAVAICLLFLIYKLKTKYRILLFCTLAVGVVLVMLYIPEDYLLYIGDRFSVLSSMDKVSSGEDEIRIKFIEKGADYFISSPIWGHGYYCFSSLFKMTNGFEIYSHNNFIDTVVGGGLIGFVIYYAIYYNIWRDIKNIKDPFVVDERYMSLIMLVQLLFNALFIVYLNERFIWLLLGLLFVYNKMNKREYLIRNKILASKSKP